MSIMKRILPTFNRVLVKRCDVETITKGGIVLTKALEKQKLAKIVAVGPGCTNHLTGIHNDVMVRPGDIVVLPEYGGCTVSMDDKQTYEIYSESELLAKIEEDDEYDED